MAHIPVLLEETIQALDPESGEDFIDCTAGSGGHALEILKRTGPRGKMLGIDLDEGQISNLKKRIEDEKLGKRFKAVNGNFAFLKEIAEENGFREVSGILMDLGFSSWHIDESKKGFSFMRKEPLDMRYDAKNPLTAEKILNYWSQVEIERILREFGEEQFSEKISKEISEARKVIKIANTLQLSAIVERAVPGWYKRQKIHFATKTFQAIRMAVNGELENIEKALPQAMQILKPGGRLAVISFHSLEDRIVKDYFKKAVENGRAEDMGKNPYPPSQKEIKINPRARSAKLRAIRKK
jgi:16S rRNA (cytosine1402-N4)-methyltransferase